MITNGAVDRAVHAWIAEECSRSTVKNSLAVLVRIMEQAVRDGIVDKNPARVTGWQREYARAEDELDDPHSPGRSTDSRAGATSSSSRRAPRPASVRSPASGSATSTAPTGIWTVRRQTTPGSGGLLVGRSQDGAKLRVV
jgi:hypothetical protein